MSVNGLTGSVATSAASAYNYTASKPTGTVNQKTTEEVSAKSSAASEGVKYEKSADVAAEKSAAENKKTYKQDPKIIAQPEDVPFFKEFLDKNGISVGDNTIAIRPIKENL